MDAPRKLGRKCELKIEIDPRVVVVGLASQGQNTLTIPDGITIEFEISRQFLSSSQEARFTIFNLDQATRDHLQKDAYATNEFRAIQFRAGYEGTPLSLVFNGFVLTASSTKRTPTDSVTEITAQDGGLTMANGFTARSIAAGTTVRDLLVALAKSLPNLAGAPIVGNFASKNLRGKTLLGNTWQLILDESGGLATIDNGQVKVLNLDEAIDAPVLSIESASGLLGTPRRTASMLEFDMIFEPRFTIGQIVQLNSSFNKLLNGVYKVSGFTHRGVISPVVSGEAITTVSLFFGLGEFNLVKGNLVQ